MTEIDKTQSAFTTIGRAVEQQFNIKIDADGRWFHEGGEIRRKALVKLFATVLKCDSDGVFWLETPVERGRIDVADAPFIATALRASEAGAETDMAPPSLIFTTNVDDEVRLDVAHPLHLKMAPDGGGLRPYIEVRNGLLAKLSRPVYYELAAQATIGEDGRLGVWSHDQFFVME
jgi:hypothetical protein